MDHTQVIFEQPINPFVAEFMESGNLIEAQHVPQELFTVAPQISAQDNWVLLRENGFAVSQDKGLTGLVIDSLYIGHRYRNQIQFENFTLWIETQTSLTPREHINVQYVHEALTLK